MDRQGEFVGHDVAFCGRRDDLARAQQRFRRGEHLLVSGRAGIGKTRLAVELIRREDIGSRHVERLLASPATSGFSLAALAPVGVPQGVDPGNLAAVLSWYLGVWRSREGLSGPPIVWVDDVQYLDGLSAMVLRHAAVHGCIQLLATHRTTEPLGDDIHALMTEGAVSEIPLAPLQEADGRELAEAVVGRSLTADEAHEIAGRGAGYPLYIRELSESIRDHRSTETSLEALVGRRFAELTPAVRRCAAKIAFAEPLPIEVLRGEREHLRELETRGLVQAVADVVRLDHPMFGEMLRASHASEEAELFTELAATDAEIDVVTRADWAVRSGRPPDRRLAMQAASDALARSDGAAALRFLAGVDEADRQLLQGQAQILVGDLEAGLAALERVRNTGGPIERVEAAATLARILGLMVGQFDVAHQIVTEADGDDLAVAERQSLALARMWLFAFGPGAHKDDELAEAISLVRGDMEPSVEAHGLALGVAGVLYLAGDGLAAVEMIRRFRAIETEVEIAPDAAAQAQSIEAWFFAYYGRFRDAASAMARTLAWCEDIAQMEGVSLLAGSAGFVAAASGDVRKGIGLASRGVEAAKPVDFVRFGELARLTLEGNRVLAGLPVDRGDVDPRPTSIPAPQNGYVELMLSSRARLLLAERESAVDALDRAEVFEKLLTGRKAAIAGLLLVETVSSDWTSDELERAVLHLVGGSTDGVAGVARDVAAARLAGDASALLRLGRVLESMPLPMAATRSYGDAIRLGLAADARATAVAGIVRCRRMWTGGFMWWLDDLTLPSARQLEIGDRVLAGASASDVAADLVLSTRTVENHLYRLTKAVGASGVDDLRATLQTPEPYRAAWDEYDLLERE